MKTSEQSQFLDLVHQAADTYFASIKTAVKLQEDVANRWAAMFKQLGESGESAQARAQSASSKALPKAQQTVEEALDVLEESTRKWVDLLNRATKVSQASNVPEAQDQLRRLWEDSLTAVRDNAQLMLQAMTRSAEAYADFVKRTSSDVPSTGNAQGTVASQTG